MHAILPRFLAARVLVAAHDVATYKRLDDLSGRLYKLDSDIAVAGQSFRASRSKGLKELGRLFPEAQKLHEELAGELAKIVSAQAQR
jgi:hypothetical protein